MIFVFLILCVVLLAFVVLGTPTTLPSEGIRATPRELVADRFPAKRGCVGRFDLRPP